MDDTTLAPLVPRDVLQDAGELDRDLSAEAREAKRYFDAADSENTQRAYRASWRIYQAWCRRHHLTAMPAIPEQVATFLSGEAAAGRKLATLRTRLAAIKHQHEMRMLQLDRSDPERARFDFDTGHPAIRRTLRGIRRDRPELVQRKPKAPLVADALREVMAAFPAQPTPADLRDRALLLIDFAGAFRRSELVAIDVEHIERHTKGLVVRVPRSKTNVEGEAEYVAILRGADIDPVAALEQWLASAGIAEGPVFRRVDRFGHVHGRLSAQTVNLVLKQRAAAAGLNPAQFGSHSLRRGFLSSARSTDLVALRKHARHARVDTTMLYIERDPFADHVGEGVL